MEERLVYLDERQIHQYIMDQILTWVKGKYSVEGSIQNGQQWYVAGMITIIGCLGLITYEAEQEYKAALGWGFYK